MRAFNDGRFLETELKLLEKGKGLAWGFALGQIRTSSVMRITGERRLDRTYRNYDRYRSSEEVHGTHRKPTE